MRKNLLLAAAVTVLIIGCIGCFTACGEKVTDAKSLAAANAKAQAAVTNFHMDDAFDMTMKMKMDGMEEVLGTSSFDLPIKMDIKMDSGKESAHGDITVGMTFLGQSVDTTAETYVDIANKVTYTKDDATKEWTRTESDATMSGMADSVSNLGEDVLSKAVFSESDDAYTLELDAAVMGDAIKDMDLFSGMNMDTLDIKDLSIDSGKITYTFDKETVLIKTINMKDVTVNASGDMSGTTYGLEIPINADFTFSKYGELDPSAYEIPADVISSTGGSVEETTPTLPFQKKKDEDE